MKFATNICLLLLLVLFAQQSLCQDTLIGIIMSGQSNMDGRGSVSALSDSQKALPPNLSFVSNWTNRPWPWMVNPSATSFGPEISFCHTIAARYPSKEFMVIKKAQGGLSINSWKPGSGTMHQALVDMQNGMEAYFAPKVIVWSAYLWVQGEADALNATSANSYYGKLVELIDDSRTQFRNANLPWLITPTEFPDFKQADYPYADIVTQAKMDVADSMSNITIVPIAGLELNADGVHFSSNGQLGLGVRFADSIMQYLGQQTVSVRQGIGRISDPGLINVWPNPFMTSVEIRVISATVPQFHSSTVKTGIKVFDLNGRLVSNQADCGTVELQHCGTSYRWHAQDQPAGIYVIRVHSEGRTLQKKVTLIK
jgi:hypothetical protein